MSESEDRTGLGDRTRDVLRDRPAALVAAVFLVGLLLGWWVLGWLIFPVEWTDAAPVDLAPGWQAAWVQLVADNYARDGDAERAQALLDGITGDTLTATIGQLTAGDRDPVSRQNALTLAEGLGLSPPESAPSTVATTGDGGPDLAQLTRWVAATLLIAALAAALALLWAWIRWRRDSGAGEQDSEGRQADEAPPLDASAAEPGSRSAGAPPWRPLRIDLGETVTARYAASDERYYQTWLVYDERGGLVGSAGLQAHAIGSVNTLDLWFFMREDESEDVDTPMVTIVSEAAFADTVFRARLGDRNVIPALPGQRHVLETGDLVLDTMITSVSPEPGSSLLGLDALTMTLTADRRAGTSDATDGEPPVPLPFRRD